MWAASCSSLLCLHNPSHSHSKEDPHACDLWLIKHQNATPQIYVGLLAQHVLFSKPTHGGLLWHTYSFTRQLSSSLLYSVCLAWQIMATLLADDYCWLLLALGRKEGEGRSSRVLAYTFPFSFLVFMDLNVSDWSSGETKKREICL